jgi:hypothetical protein
MEQNENRTIVATVDFRAISVKDIEGRLQPVDVSKPLGNLLYMQGRDIVECELGRDIYHATAPTALDRRQLDAVLQASKQFPYVTQRAIAAACQACATHQEQRTETDNSQQNEAAL